jgi:8-hydroxy-5-deazaflavin:NADPH oxidoreductase
MTVAVIGTGNLGTRVARRLADGGVDVVVAASNVAGAQSAAARAGHGARAADVADAIGSADTVVFATWFATTKELLAQHAAQLSGKIVVDPSNNIALDESGGAVSQNPQGVSAGQQLADAVPADAGYVKAFGTLTAELLDSTATESGDTPVLFYATDDDAAGRVVAELITTAGFDPVKVGGVDASSRIEVFGDLHPLGGLNGRMLGRDEALQLLNK